MSSDDNKTASNIDEDISEILAEPATEPSDPAKQKTRYWPWLILIVLLCAGTLSFLYVPMDKFTQTFASLDRYISTSDHNNTPTEASTIKAPTEEFIGIHTTELPLVTTIKNDRLASKLIEPKAVSSPTTTAQQEQILDRRYDDLQLRINNLEQLIQTLKESNIQTAQTLKTFESLQLRTQLNIIARGHLPEIHQAWQDIASFPSLNDEQKQVAETMIQISKNNLASIQHWQQAISGMMNALPLAQAQNIIPEVSSPWLQWLNGYFSLKKAPSSKLNSLESLLKIQQQLNTEAWPEPSEWARTRVNLENALAAQKNANTAELISALPETFKDIRHDIETMKQTASHWLEE